MDVFINSFNWVGGLVALFRTSCEFLEGSAKLSTENSLK